MVDALMALTLKLAKMTALSKREEDWVCGRHPLGSFVIDLSSGK